MKNKDEKRLRPRISLTLLPDLVEQCRALAEAEGRSLSSYIEQLMREASEGCESELETPSTTTPRLEEIKGKQPKKKFTPNPDIVAGASTVTKKRITPNTNEKSA